MKRHGTARTQPRKRWVATKKGRCERPAEARRAGQKGDGIEVRLSKLSDSERRAARKVLDEMGTVGGAGREGYRKAAGLVVSMLENGRLKGLQESLAGGAGMPEKDLLKILAESDVLTALNAAEAAKARICAIECLQGRIKKRALGKAVRDHLVSSPGFIGPRWDTYAVEAEMTAAFREHAEKAGMSRDSRRIDLALSSGDRLLILEMARPKKPLGWEDVHRFVRYVQTVRTALKADVRFKSCKGCMIGDSIGDDPALRDYLAGLEDSGVTVRSWQGLLDEARAEWAEYLRMLADRGSGDPRLGRLASGGGRRSQEQGVRRSR